MNWNRHATWVLMIFLAGMVLYGVYLAVKAIMDRWRGGPRKAKAEDPEAGRVHVELYPRGERNGNGPQGANNNVNQEQ